MLRFVSSPVIAPTVELSVLKGIVSTCVMQPRPLPVVGSQQAGPVTTGGRAQAEALTETRRTRTVPCRSVV